MSEMTTAPLTCDPPQISGRRLPAGVQGMGHLMPQVLARYGLEIEESVNQPAAAAACFAIRSDHPRHALRCKHLAAESLQESLAMC